MKVRMLEDAPGSPDGTTVNQYDKGKVYDLPDDLVSVMIKYLLAVEYEPQKFKIKKAPAPTENKAVK